MKLIDAIKQNGRPFEVPDCTRDDLPQFFVEMGYKVGAEIGVEKGEFSVRFCKAGLTHYAIDPWQNYKDYSHRRGQERFDFQYEYTKGLLARFPNCKIIRKMSMVALDDFTDNSLDYVYIDANHEFRYVAEDIDEWTRKVRPGGVVSGHDFFYTSNNPGQVKWHVAYVLKAYVGAYNIPNWYVIGSKNPKEGEKRDKWRSWFFVKP